MQTKFLIFAPPFNENVGGHILLHKLCDLINKHGGEGFLVPLFANNQISVLNWSTALKSTMNQLSHYENILKNPNQFYPRNPSYNTPLYPAPLQDISKLENTVVVYPEITLGNPLNAKNVARWMLHNSGFHTGLISAIKGEVQFRYRDMFHGVSTPGVEIAPFLLNIVEIPWALYESSTSTHERSGTAYMLRKGKGRKIVHDLGDSICIDGKPHNEVAEIFKKVKTFISYDTETMYSVLAVIAGAISVIIPNDAQQAKELKNAESTKHGLAINFDDIPRALATTHLLIEKHRRIEEEGEKCVSTFIEFWNSRLKKI